MKKSITTISALALRILGIGNLCLATNLAIANTPIDYEHLNYDYRDSWGPAKNQENLYSCHVFATEALVEAEYARSFGAKINLSEGDLFLKYFLRAGTKVAAEESIKTIFAGVQIPNITDKIDSEEVGNIDFDFTLLKELGMKSEDEFSYDTAVSFMGDLSYAAWLISIDNQDISTTDQNFLNNEAGILNNLYSPSRILDKENDWLQKLNLRTTYLFGLSNEQKKEKVISALACKAVGVLVAPGLYEGVQGDHVVVLAGYQGDSNEFLVRNSWGQEGLFFSSYETIGADDFLSYANAYSYIENQALPCAQISSAN